MQMRTCVTPRGEFVYGIHKPTYRVVNLREDQKISLLGSDEKNLARDNRRNFPPDHISIQNAGWVYEIPNPFYFKGTTYISKNWADKKAENPLSITLAPPTQTSLLKNMQDNSVTEKQCSAIFSTLPATIKVAIAAVSTDSEELKILARNSCELIFDESTGRPLGLKYHAIEGGETRPVIHDHTLYDCVANNIHLPDDYKEVMVLRPGAQGDSEIVGEWHAGKTEAVSSHVFEYLRTNSYIPWGHYAANMADDSVRYRIADLAMQDFTGLRHLYYQRTYVRLAEDLHITGIADRHCCTREELENLRIKIADTIARLRSKGDHLHKPISTRGTIWGWNYGFDCAPSGYRLHASHQQIHQQYAMVPAGMEVCSNGETDKNGALEPFSCGDMIAQCAALYHQETGSDFFTDYINAIKNNRRCDGRINDRDSLIVYEDEFVMLFVPKAQTSQWELQLITLQPIGNVLDADSAARNSIDQAMILALRVLTMLGARMVTTIEYAKSFDSGDTGNPIKNQRLLYVFLPKLPESPGGFSEAQLRFIIGHYPEDFAAACRAQL